MNKSAAWTMAALSALLGMVGPGVAGDTPSGGGDGDANALSRQATDPTASLMSLQFIGGYVGGYHGDQPGLEDDRTELKLQSAIPFDAFGQPNILRMTLPYQVDGRGDEGLGDVSLFDLVVINERWGRWGLGPVVTMATRDDAPDDIVAGPAIGGVYQCSKRLSLGLFNQNVFGGDTGISQLQPIVAYQLGDGWSLSAGDLQDDDGLETWRVTATSALLMPVKGGR